MTPHTFRWTVVGLLVAILVQVSDPGFVTFLFFIWAGVAAVFLIGAGVVLWWDGDKDVDDWLDPGSTRRNRP